MSGKTEASDLSEFNYLLDRLAHTVFRPVVGHILPPTNAYRAGAVLPTESGWKVNRITQPPISAKVKNE